MKNQTTIFWFVLALLLFSFIWIYDHHFAHPETTDSKLLPGLRATALTEIHLAPAGAKDFTLVRTNDSWYLQKPLVYPAQNVAVAALLEALEKLTATPITKAELNGKSEAEAGFGFDAPQATLDLTAGATQWHLLIGNKTAPGDQVFLKIPGKEGALVADSAWLPLLPHGLETWRDTALIGPVQNCDWIVITNGAKTIELRRNATNKLWRMVQPLATRADSARIAAALQQLATAQTTRFVTDDPKADLTAYGLDPAATDLWLGSGTNLLAAVHSGKISAEDPQQIYVRRDALNSVATAAKDALADWTGGVDGFRDSHLFELHSPVAEILVRNVDTNFTLVFNGDNGWRVAGEKFPVDAESVVNFVKLLAGWRVSEFVKDVTTATDLEKYGLAQPSQQIVFRGTAGDTNSTVAQILFGNIETNRVFVKRGDEDSIYALPLADFKRLPVEGWQFRSHRLWNFSVTNVASVTLRQGGQTRTLLRNGINSWSLAASSQGLIKDVFGVEEAVTRLGTLDAQGWVARNFSTPETFGFNPNNLQLTVELKSAEKFTLDFGDTVPQTQTVFAAATLDGERWAFVFPPVLAPLIAEYLTIPPGTP